MAGTRRSVYTILELQDLVWQQDISLKSSGKVHRTWVADVQYQPMVVWVMLYANMMTQATGTVNTQRMLSNKGNANKQRRQYQIFSMYPLYHRLK